MNKIFDIKTKIEIFENLPDFYIIIIFDNASGGFLIQHPAHGKNEITLNTRIGKLLATAGHIVELCANDHADISFDALVDGDEWEFKTITNATNLKGAVQRELRKGKIQSGNILLFIDKSTYNLQDITKGIYNAVKFDLKSQIVKIALLFPCGKLISFSREEVKNNMFLKKIYSIEKEQEARKP